jgi:hypothetical protein
VVHGPGAARVNLFLTDVVPIKLQLPTYYRKLGLCSLARL